MNIRNIYYDVRGNRQMILSFSNNNDVIVNETMFIVGGKQYNMSKKRLTQEFSLLSKNDGVEVYRTHRVGLPNWVIFLFDEYQFVESFRREHKRLYAKDKAEKKDLPHVAPEKVVVDITPYVDGDKHYYVMNCPTKGKVSWKSGVRFTTTPVNRCGYYEATIFAIKQLINYDFIEVINVIVPDGQHWIRDVAIGKVRGGIFSQAYAQAMKMLREKAEGKGISICFKEE